MQITIWRTKVVNNYKMTKILKNKLHIYIVAEVSGLRINQ